MSADAPLLEVRDLTVTYPDAAAPAVRGAGLVVRAGEAVALVGESGAGKTTVGLAVLGLLPRGARAEGRVRWRGRDLLGRPRAYAPLRWRRLALVLQDAMNAFNPVTAIGEQLAELWEVHERRSRRDAWARAEDALERVGLPADAARRYPHELSGGMRQRAAVAMAFALDPDLVVADEPTSALDAAAAGEMTETLNAARRERGAALLLITHDLATAARAAERMIVMDRGEIAEEGPVERVLSRPRSDAAARLLAAVPRLPAGAGGGAA